MRSGSKSTGITLLTLLGWVCVGFAQSGRPEPTPPAAPPARLGLTSLIPEATIELGGERYLAATPDGVWVASRTAGTVVRIDPKTNAQEKPIAIGKEPCYSLVFAFKTLWTSLCSESVLRRLNPAEPDKPATIKTAIRGAGPLISATGSIWMVTDPKGALVRIDPDTNAVVAEISVRAGATSLVAAGDAIWVISSAQGVVTRVNGHSNVVEDTIKVGRTPIAAAAGEGSVWVLNGGDGTVSRIDQKSNKVTETIKTGATGATGSIAFGEGSVWISSPGVPLSRVDPRTNRLAQQFTGPGGGVLAIALKSIWLAATPTQIWRIDPRRVEATQK